jgi:hypothetical protein
MAFKLVNAIAHFVPSGWGTAQTALYNLNKRSDPTFVKPAVDTGDQPVGVELDRWLAPRSAATFSDAPGFSQVLDTDMSRAAFAMKDQAGTITCRQQMTPAFASNLRYNVALSIGAFPTQHTVKHAVRVAVHQMMTLRGLPEPYRQPLIDAMTRDMTSLLAEAAKRGCFDRGIEFSASYELIPGSTSATVSRRSAAVLDRSMVRQGALPRLVATGPSLAQGRAAFATMDDLHRKAKNGTLTFNDVANYFYRNRRDESVVQGLLSPLEPMHDLTTAFTAFAKDVLAPQPAGKARTSAPSPSTTFHAAHDTAAKQPLPGSPLHHFMSEVAIKWKPTHEPKELAFRFVRLMAAYDAQDAHLELQQTPVVMRQAARNSQASAASLSPLSDDSFSDEEDSHYERPVSAHHYETIDDDDFDTPSIDAGVQRRDSAISSTSSLNFEADRWATGGKF